MRKHRKGIPNEEVNQINYHTGGEHENENNLDGVKHNENPVYYVEEILGKRRRGNKVE